MWVNPGRVSNQTIDPTTGRVIDVGGRGSGRILLDSDTDTAIVTVYQTFPPIDPNAVASFDLIGNNSSADLYIVNAGGGVGLASRVYGEAFTLRNLGVARNSNAQVWVGNNVTLNTSRVWGGTVWFWSSPGSNNFAMNGGTVYLEGEYNVSGIGMSGGTLYPNNVTAGADIDVIEMRGGVLDATMVMRGRTWTIVDQAERARFVWDADEPGGGGLNVDQLTVTTWERQGMN